MRLWSIMLVALLLTVIGVSYRPGDNDNCRGDSSCFFGNLTKIVDGDTLEVSGEVIRLSLVNTPEKGQSGFDESIRFVESSCKVGEIVLVDEDDMQVSRSHRRIVAKVYCRNGTFDLNRELVMSGNAEILEKFCGKSEFSDEEWVQNNGC